MFWWRNRDCGGFQEVGRNMLGIGEKMKRWGYEKRQGRDVPG
jgi:hypothetical protein